MFQVAVKDSKGEPVACIALDIEADAAGKIGIGDGIGTLSTSRM